MTNRVISAVLLSLLIYVTAATAVHSHQVRTLTHDHCPACLWLGESVAEVPEVCVVAPANAWLILQETTGLVVPDDPFRGRERSRAPPVAAV